MRRADQPGFASLPCQFPVMAIPARVHILPSLVPLLSNEGLIRKQWDCLLGLLCTSRAIMNVKIFHKWHEDLPAVVTTIVTLLAGTPWNSRQYSFCWTPDSSFPCKSSAQINYHYLCLGPVATWPSLCVWQQGLLGSPQWHPLSSWWQLLSLLFTSPLICILSSAQNPQNNIWQMMPIKKNGEHFSFTAF